VTSNSFELFARRALGQAPAGFAHAKTIPSGLESGLEAAEEARLWEAHSEAMALFHGPPLPPPSPEAAHTPNLMDLKLELARRLLGPCRLCWLRCPVDRTAGETGACGLGASLRP
jgi:putative pyruvate formate lyase activating enzyme